MAFTDPQTLLALTNCYQCRPTGEWFLLKLGLLQQLLLQTSPTADVSRDNLLAQAKCFNCVTPGQWDLIRAALLQIAALSGTPTMDTSLDGLIANTKCYLCDTPGFWPLFDLGLLAQTVLTNDHTADVSAQALLSRVNCYQCTSPGIWALLELGLLKLLAAAVDATADLSVDGLLNRVKCLACATSAQLGIATTGILVPMATNPPARGLPIIPLFLTDLYMAVPASQNLTTAGATLPVTWTVFSGALPDGMTLSAAGVLSGTPTALGTFNFQIRVTDSAAPPKVGTRSYTLNVTSAPADAEVTDWVARVIANGGSVSAATNAAANGFMYGIKTLNPTIRAKIYRLNFFAGTGYNPGVPNAGAPTIPLIKDKGNVADSVSGTAPAYTETGAGGGLDLTGGVNGRLVTGLIPSVDFPDSNSAHLAAYVMVAPSTGGHIVSVDTAGTGFYVLYTSNDAFHQWGIDLCDAAGLNFVVSRIGFLVANRTAANARQGYQNGLSVGSDAQASVAARPTKNFEIFCFKDDVPDVQNFWLGRCGGYSIGLGLTPGEQLAFYNTWQAFQTALGRQV